MKPSPSFPSLPSVQENAEGVYVSVPELAALRYQARGYSLLPRQPLHSLLAGRHASRLRGRGLNFEELRRYQPGDDVRQIDWKATLRTRKTQSRVYTEERERSVLLVVDQRRGMFFGSARSMKSVVAAQAAALAAWRVLAQQDRIGALVFNDAEIREVRPQRSEANVLRVLGEIVRLNQALSVKDDPPDSAAMFNRVLQHAANLVPHDGLVCIISDGAGSDDESRRVLSRIAQHNDVLFAFVFDPLETDLPDAGPLVLSDGRGQLEVDTSNRTLRAEFQRTFAEQRAAGRKFLLQRETPVLPLNAAEDVATQLRRQFGTPGR